MALRNPSSQIRTLPKKHSAVPERAQFGLRRTNYYFGGSRIKREGQRNKPDRVRRWEQTLFTGREFEFVGHADQFNQ
jgi:hypothetical protein